jgi:hypothetical protein
MAGIAEIDPDIRRRIERYVVFDRLEQVAALDRVFHRVERRRLGASGPAGLAVLPFLLRLLDMAGIRQHDPAQVRSRLGRVDRAAVAVRVKLGDPAAVIDVRVGQQQEIQVIHLKRKRTLIELFFPG